MLTFIMNYKFWTFEVYIVGEILQLWVCETHQEIKYDKSLYRTVHTKQTLDILAWDFYEMEMINSLSKRVRRRILL